MNLREINQIYNSFEVKDMPRHEFVKKMQEITNPTEAQKDLGRIMTAKRMEARKRMEIDRAIADAN